MFKAWSIVLLMFNSDHFDVNNTTTKLAQLFHELNTEYLLTHLTIYIMLINQISKQNISEFNYRPKSIDSNLSL